MEIGSTDRTAFGEFAQAQRTAVGLKQIDAAEVLEVSRAYLSQIEHGRQIPSEDLCDAMAQLYKCDAGEFRTRRAMARATPGTRAALAKHLSSPGSNVQLVAEAPRWRPLPVAGFVSADAEANVVFERGAEAGSVEFGVGVVVWQVSGDSMDPVARHGQHLIVDPDARVADGDLVIVCLRDGRTLFKRYWEDGRMFTLESVNSRGGHRPILVKRPTVSWINKVVGVKF